MKKHWLKFVVVMLISTGFSLASLGDPPLPPDHGQNGNQPVGAPIDGGLGILLALGAAYGGRKIYRAVRKDVRRGM